MALQGSIDTFALDDVLRLVASTSKSGRLTLRGTRGEGELVVRDGYVLGGSVTTDERIDEPHELVFELLRLDDGDFVFESVEIDDFAGVEPTEVSLVLESATELLDEWREIEAVIPDHRAVVALAADGPDGTVKIDPGQWQMIAVIAGGAPVGELGQRLDTSTLETGRVLRSLVELGLLSVSEAEVLEDEIEEQAELADVAALEIVEVEVPVEAFEVDTDPLAATFEPGVWADEPASYNGNGNGTNGHAEVDTEVLFESVHDATAVSLTDSHLESEAESWDALDTVPADPAEFAHRLAELSPQAAKAVAAAARATTVEERDAALAELDGTGEEVDHDVLLQLLGPIEG
ncbi:MAG TPA: DUF4388 domain-containing protein [Acidimicrobiales bacterium]